MSTARTGRAALAGANAPRSANRPDVLEARVGADRPRLLAHHLHAVVVRRIVARRDHDAAVELAAERGEVREFGAADADVEHVDAGVGETARDGGGERRARQADVAADRDGLRLDETPRKPRPMR